MLECDLYTLGSLRKKLISLSMNTCNDMILSYSQGFNFLSDLQVVVNHLFNTISKILPYNMFIVSGLRLYIISHFFLVREFFIYESYTNVNVCFMFLSVLVR